MLTRNFADMLPKGPIGRRYHDISVDLKSVIINLPVPSSSIGRYVYFACLLSIIQDDDWRDLA